MEEVISNKNTETSTLPPLTVLVIEPEKIPYIKQIDHGLESLQHEVGGDIEVTYPYMDMVGLVVNETGKIDGLPPNRVLRDDNGKVYDIISGTFLVVGLSEDNFCSLSEEYIKKYMYLFGLPEAFIQLGNKLIVL